MCHDTTPRGMAGAHASVRIEQGSKRPDASRVFWRCGEERKQRGLARGSSPWGGVSRGSGVAALRENRCGKSSQGWLDGRRRGPYASASSATSSALAVSAVYGIHNGRLAREGKMKLSLCTPVCSFYQERCMALLAVVSG